MAVAVDVAGDIVVHRETRVIACDGEQFWVPSTVGRLGVVELLQLEKHRTVWWCANCLLANVCGNEVDVEVAIYEAITVYGVPPPPIDQNAGCCVCYGVAIKLVATHEVV